MKLPNSEHTSHPWRIREIASDFTLLDVWALPVDGTAKDFQDLIDLVISADPSNLESLPARFLWEVRDRMGKWFGLGRISTSIEVAGVGGPGRAIPRDNEIPLAHRLPSELRNSTGNLRFAALPFVPLYRTDDEFAAELSNRTVHGLLHLGWVKRSDGTYTGQMAVYVQPRGKLGACYMRLIEPFRQLIVYPALMRQIARTWAGRGDSGLKVVT